MIVENSNNLALDTLDPEVIGEDMIRAIHNLASDDKNMRWDALLTLWNMTWHQGDLSWSASLIVPFLLQRLQEESDTGILYNILIDLAHLATGSSGSSPSYARKDLPMYQDISNTPEFQEQIEEELYWMDLTYQSVYKGVNIYLNLLENESPEIRIGAAYTLSSCQPDAARICTKMSIVFHQESEEIVKATIPLCLAILSNSTPLETGLFDEILNSNERDIVKLSAAIAFAYIAGETMPDNAFNIFLHLMIKPNLFATLSAHYENPMATAHHLLVIDFLTRLNRQQMARLISTIAQQPEEIRDDYLLADLQEIVGRLTAPQKPGNFGETGFL